MAMHASGPKLSILPAHPLDPLSADEVRILALDHISVPTMVRILFRLLRYPYLCATTLPHTPPSRLSDLSQTISFRRLSAPFSRTSASHSRLVNQ